MDRIITRLPHINQLIEQINMCENTGTHTPHFLQICYKHIHKTMLFINELSNRPHNNIIKRYIHTYLNSMKKFIQEYREKNNTMLKIYSINTNIIEIQRIMSLIITLKIINNEVSILKCIFKFFEVWSKICHLT